MTAASPLALGAILLTAIGSLGLKLDLGPPEEVQQHIQDDGDDDVGRRLSLVEALTQALLPEPQVTLRSPVVEALRQALLPEPRVTSLRSERAVHDQRAQTVLVLGRIAGERAAQPRETSLLIDPTQNVFNQAFAQLYNNHSKSLRHFGSVVFETHGAKDAGIDVGALTRDFIAELAKHIPSADLLHDLYGDSIYRLAPIRFVERIRDQEGFIHKFPDVPQSSVPEDRLRFLGGVLARFFLGGSQTSSGSLPLASGLLPFAMDPRIYAALAAGVAPELKPAAEDVVALPECGGVAALLGNADGNASDIFKFFTKDYYEAESMRVFPLGMDFPDARTSVVAACKRYVDAAWAKPINWVLEGWLQELGGQQGLGKRRAGREPVDFAEHLRGAMQRTEPLAIENLTGVSLTVSVADNVNGSAEDFMPTFEGALKEIRDGSDALRGLSGEMNAPWRPSGGDQRVRNVVQYWTGSPNYDNTKEYKLHVKQHTECQYGNYGVYASACDWRLDVPAACFQGGISLTAQALFYTAVMNGKGYGMV